jgi:release factor glutamine methyltransferase
MQPDQDGLSVSHCLLKGGLPRLELQMLLAHVLQRDRAWLIAHDDYLLDSHERRAFDALRRRRVQGEPMAYILGEREFMSLSFEVNAHVLIPRPETELLVQTALEILRPLLAPVVLDLGTGSGVIAVSVAKQRPDAQVWASDSSSKALEVAKRNAHNNGVEIGWIQGSWFEPLAALPMQKGFDAILSNPPYIAVTDAHLDQGDLRFEPRSALTDEADGLSAYRSIARDAKRYLRHAGVLLFEHGFEQADAIVEILGQAGYEEINTVRDLAGHPRVTLATYNGDQSQSN